MNKAEQQQAIERLSKFNRDVIRRAAKAVGVVNVSYRSKAENISIMVVEYDVVDLVNGEPVYEETAAPPMPNTEAATAKAAEVADAIEQQWQEEFGSEPNEPSCNAERDGWLCTLSPYHEGDHEAWGIAGDGDAPFLTWANESFDSPVPASVHDDQAPSHADLDADDEDAILSPAVESAPVPTKPRAFNLNVDSRGRSTVTFVSRGQLVSLREDDESYVRVVDALLRGEDPDFWINATAILEGAVSNFGNRVTLVQDRPGPGGRSEIRVLFDGKPIHGRIVDMLTRYHIEGRDVSNLVRFLERLDANPVESAKEGLFRWAGADRGLSIDADGYFIGFKAVYRDVVDADGVQWYRSSSSGWATVDGVEQGSRYDKVAIRQKVGSIVTMPAVDVKPGPECSVGLHVGSHHYADTFLGGQGVVMEVRVDPADVVNVPDHDTGKMRVVKYEVVQFHERGDGNARHHEPAATWIEEEVTPIVESVVPEGFWKRLLRRRGGGRKVEVED